MTCFCCGTINLPGSVKFGIAYSKCSKCGSIYTTVDISSVMQTDNDNSYERNSLPLNEQRIKWASKWLNRPIKEALDFGCGQGFLMNLLETHGVNAAGINYDTKEMIDYLPFDYFDAIFMIETIEHLPNPKEIFARLDKSLKKDGLIIVETTFADSINNVVNNEYVDPRIGHINVISKAGLKEILPSNYMISTINPNVVCLWRP